MFITYDNSMSEFKNEHSDDEESIDYEDFDGQTISIPHPADITYFYNDNNQFDYTDDEDTPQDLLIAAAERNNIEEVKKLINSGVNINVLEWGWSALHWVVTHYDESSQRVPEYIINAINILIEMGANIDITGDMNETPLHHAANLGLFESCEILLQNGASKTIKDKFGWSPLHYAAAKGNTRTTRTLLLFGADLNDCIANDVYVESNAAALASKYKRNKSLTLLLEKCTYGTFTYENWIRNKHKKFSTILENNLKNIPYDICDNIANYWIDISRLKWLNEVWPLSVSE